jgi:hypothetical protein
VPLTPALLRLDPMFDPLRNDARFQLLVSGGAKQSRVPSLKQKSFGIRSMLLSSNASGLAMVRSSCLARAVWNLRTE